MYPTFIGTHCFWPGYQLLFRKSPKRQSTLWRSSRTFGMWLISASEVSATSGAFPRYKSDAQEASAQSPLATRVLRPLSGLLWRKRVRHEVPQDSWLGEAPWPSKWQWQWLGGWSSLHPSSPPPHCPALGKLPRNRNINSIQLPPYYLALPNTLIIIPQFYSPSILQTILKD